ncbi:MAG: hypothetical protein AB8B55_11785 [Mariniblastus sp.]
MVKRLLVVLLSVSCGIACSFGPMTVQAQATKTAETAKTTGEKSAEPATKLANQKIGTAKDAVAAADDKKKAIRVPAEMLLPANTRAFFSVPDAKKLEARFDATEFAKLIKDPSIKPFFDSFETQMKDWLNAQNVRLGIDIDDLHGVHSGEICLAGVLPDLKGDRVATGAHGMVFLVDVSDSLDEAKKLLVKINKNLAKKGAEQKKFEINGLVATKSIMKNKERIRTTQTNYQIICNGWLLVSDNDAIFREVLKRVASPKKIMVEETLAKKRSFVAIQERAKFKDHESQIRWYVDPFGYIQLAQLLEDESLGTRKQRDNWAGLLKGQGFDSFQGMGGNIAVATGEHEILHRTFTYAPKRPSAKNGTRIFELFDFNTGAESMDPPSWVPADCSAYVVANWEFTKALGSVHYLYDAFIGEEGSFKRMLSDFKVDPDMSLDIEKLVGMIDNRFTVASAVATPITERSEQIAIGFPIKPGGDPKFVFDSFKRATSATSEVFDLGKYKVIMLDSTKEIVEEKDDWDFPDDEIDDEEDEEREFSLFEKKFIVVAKGHLLITNNKDFLRKILSQKVSGLDKTPDYIQVYQSLDKITDIKKVKWRQMGRIDHSLEANYEMLRRGEMGKSQTVIARVMNEIFAKKQADDLAAGKEADPEAIRKQKLDGSKLPADYRKSVAPYFGPMGWALEVEDEGWRVTGCILKKKGMTEVVRKIGDETDNAKKR